MRTSSSLRGARAVCIFLLLCTFVRAAAAQELYVQVVRETTLTQSPISSLTFSPNGKYLAIGGMERVAWLWDVQSLQGGMLGKTLQGHLGAVLQVSFSPDGKLLASCGRGNQIFLWNGETGALLRIVKGDAPMYRAVTFSPDGKIVIGGGSDKAIRLWKVESGDEVDNFKEHDAEISSLSFSPDGIHLASGSYDKTVKVWNFSKGKDILTLKGSFDRINGVSYSPDGKLIVAAGADSVIHIWDAVTGAKLHGLKGYHGSITAISFHPNGQWLASIGTDNSIKIWDLVSKTVQKSIPDASGFPTSVAFSPDSTILAVGNSVGVLRLFKVSTRPPDTTPPVITILTPKIQNPENLRRYGTEFEISGLISDNEKVKELFVNGQSISLQEPSAKEQSMVNAPSVKKFQAAAKLPKVGTNDVLLKALDEAGNTAEQHLMITRLTKDQAVEIVFPKENYETDQPSVNLTFRVSWDFVSYSIVLNTIELVQKKNTATRKDTTGLYTETIPLVPGFNQVQLTVKGVTGEQITKLLTLNRKSVAAAATTTPVERKGVGPQRWAVVVGISQYSKPGIPSLSYCHKDAQEIYEFLKTPQGGAFEEDHMKLLLNQDATLENIRSALFEFLRQAIDKDFVVIYFSGHGAPEPGNPNNMYLLTYDSDPKKLATTAFPMWDVNTALTRYINAKKVVILTDACHSGGVGEGLATKGLEGAELNLINRYLADLGRSKDGTVVFTASQPGELSQELDKFQHGVFTYYLLEGLKGKADFNNDYVVTITELMDYVEDQVKRATLGNQHPTKAATTYDKDLPMSIIPH